MLGALRALRRHSFFLYRVPGSLIFTLEMEMYLKRSYQGLLQGLLIAAVTLVSSNEFSRSAAAQSADVAVRVTQVVTDAHLVTLKGNVHPLAQARFELGPAPQSMATGRVTLVLKRSPAQEESLKAYLAALQNAASPSYHQWLTPAQFGVTYGIGDNDLQTVEQWLTGQGFKIEKVPQARNLIQFSGTVGQLQTAFHTSIHAFLIHGERHFANTTDPQIPAALAPVVQGVAHLNDIHPKAMNQPGAKGVYDPSQHKIKPSLTLFDNNDDPLLFVDPADAATIYDSPNAALNPSYSGTTYDGTGIKIGIAGDSNVSLADITNYRVAFLGETSSAANIPTVIVDGNDPGINGDEAEGLLDNEISGGLAPKAKVYFYTSSNTDLQGGLFDAVYRAIEDNTVSILSISFGECEKDLGTAGNAAASEIFEQAAAQGISVVVSTGDSGSAGCDASDSASAVEGLAVNGIASSPYTIAVGGTDYDVLANSFTTYAEQTTSGTAPYYRTALGYIPEEPWNDSTNVNGAFINNTPLEQQGVSNVVAGSGGVSAYYAKPSFQTGITPADSARDLPDVSLLGANGLYSALWVVCADEPNTGADCQTTNGQFTSNSTFSGYGGTSTSAPAFAGVLALIEQKVGSRLGQADYVLYQLAKSKYASVFHDVTKGNNSVYCASGSQDCGSNNFITGYDAGTGYDLASGLGSVDIANLVSNWSSVALGATTTSLTINGSTGPVSAVHGTSLAFNVGIAPATATGAAAVIDTANEVTGGVQNNGQLPIELTNGMGSAHYNGLPGGSYTVFARYAGDTANAASSSTPAIAVNIAAEPSTTALSLNAYSPTTGSGSTGVVTAAYGSEIFLDADVYGTAEGAAGTYGLATGSMTFSDGNTTLGKIALNSSNTASYPAIAGNFPIYAVGSHTLSASYPGDPSYKASTSAPVMLTVTQNTSSISATASSASVASNASTTLSIIVGAPSFGVAPSGTVTLTANNKTLGTLTALIPSPTGTVPAASTVTYTLAASQLIPGNNTVTLNYGGDANYKGSTTTVQISVIGAGTPAISLTNSGAVVVTAGATTGNSSNIMVNAMNGYSGTLKLGCVVQASGAAAPPTCSIPASLPVNGTSIATAALTIGSTASTTSGSYSVVVTATDSVTASITAMTTVAVTIQAPVAPSIALTNSGALTFAAGATTGNSATVTAMPAGGFTGALSLTCAISTTVASGTDAPTCVIPASVSITGTTAATATVTINSTAGSTAALHPLRGFFAPAAGTLLAFVVFFGVPKRRRRWTGVAGLLSVMICAALVGCGGGKAPTQPTNPGTTAGAYVVTVTAAGTGVTTQTTTINVTIN